MLPFSHPSQRSRYRSARSVRPSHSNSHVAKWTFSKVLFFLLALLAVATLTIIPILISDGYYNYDPFNAEHHHPTKLMGLSKAIQEEAADFVSKKQREFVKKDSRKAGENAENWSKGQPVEVALNGNVRFEDKNAKEEEKSADDEPVSPLTRGVNKLPLSHTPALIGAKRGQIQCDLPVDNERMVYWNSPQGDRDRAFTTPFKADTTDEYYLTFQPDPGGWNNIRMSMEILFVLAAATGRTLVLPPKLPMYLLGHGKDNARGFGDFFPLDNPELLDKVNVISMTEFVKRKLPEWDVTEKEKEQLLKVSEKCLHQDDSDAPCGLLNKQLRSRGYQPQLKPTDHCLIFDENVLRSGDTSSVSDDMHVQIDRFCGARRKPIYYDKKLQSTPWINWDASCDKNVAKDGCFRLLQHFYTFMHFTDPKIDNYYKRFVRDFLHYRDAVNCAAWKVVKAVQEEADKLSLSWSSMHVRRGDLQYKKVKIPAEEWYENTKEVWKPGELIYIATDERNKTFFDPIKNKGHPLRFLDDYWDIANMGGLDHTYIGMVDTVVASHGRAFAGTWFSTFTGYINRLRGYLGKTMKKSWYSFLPRKDAMIDFAYPEGNYPAREWHIGWLGIDSDEHIEEEQGLPTSDLQSLSNIRKPEDYVDPNKPSSPKKHDGKTSVSKRLSIENKPKTTERRVTHEKPDIKLSDLPPDVGFSKKPVARGVAGRSMGETQALEGAKRATIECDVNVDSLAYWNDPQGERDRDFVSPFAVQADVKYITFAPDRGGWNNIRMCMEVMFVLAAATGRTLVLPPKTPLYLLQNDAKSRHRGFADFFPLDTVEFQKRVKVISMEEFVKREGSREGRLPVPEDKRQAVEGAAEHCDRKSKDANCSPLYDYLVSVGYVPSARAKDGCIVFDIDAYNGKELSFQSKQIVERRCGERNVTYWNSEIQDPVLVHFRASEKQWRLLTHFYGFMFFTNPAIENYYKRFVRDFLHYHDSIYCAAGKIVKALQVEGMQRGFKVDDEGAGAYSAWHVRRGDLQYKKVKIPAEEWYENTKEIWQPNELLYMATDERNKTWFDPIRKHHSVRFLDDYWELAGLSNLDPNYMGMIDTIVASRGRAFAGTWFSTFTGYINRLRGYHGMSMMDSWYSYLDRKEALHKWEDVDHFAYAYEWPDGWIGIDADVWPSKDRF